ncbi:Thyroid adenoma-associated protein [Halotydeus destructor]|nr:Thyroid adenoma-associated protein [Halotydeus destructor]
MTLVERTSKLNIAEDVVDSNECRQYEDNVAHIEAFDDKLRLSSTIQLLKSIKTTKPFSAKELKALKDGFIHNIRIQTAASRIEFVTLVHRALLRIKASYSLHKRKRTLGDTEELYQDFVRWLVETCISNIYPTSYFGQRTICLMVLRHCVDLFLFPKILFNVEKCFSQRNGNLVANTLLICLLDTFEENKREALHVLTALKQQDIISFNLSDLIDVSHALSVSVNPSDSLSSRYLLRLVVNLNASRSVNDCAYDEISQLTAAITKAVSEAKVNIISGAVHNPIHTRIATLRGLLSEVDFSSVLDEYEKWSNLVSAVFEICLDACNLVEVIVCNDSPEGHLPMDCAPVSSEFIKKLSNSTNSAPVPEIKRHGVTTQMLLIFGWKTIKEAAHLFSELVVAQPKISGEKSNDAVITVYQIGELVDFFENALLEMKHKGAFEQAFFAFSSLVPKLKLLGCMEPVDALLKRILDGISTPELELEKDSKRARQFEMIFRRSAWAASHYSSHLTVSCHNSSYRTNIQ